MQKRLKFYRCVKIIPDLPFRYSFITTRRNHKRVQNELEKTCVVVKMTDSVVTKVAPSAGASRWWMSGSVISLVLIILLGAALVYMFQKMRNLEGNVQKIEEQVTQQINDEDIQQIVDSALERLCNTHPACKASACKDGVCPLPPQQRPPTRPQAPQRSQPVPMPPPPDIQEMLNSGLFGAMPAVVKVHTAGI